MYDEIQIFLDFNLPYSSQYGVLETSLWWHASKPHIVVLSSVKYLDYSPIASILLIMVHDCTPKHKIGMHSYLNEIHCGLGPPIFTSHPLHSGCVILILICTHILCPRQSPLANSSTHSTLPKVLPMALAVSLVIHIIYSPQFCTRKDAISNIVSSTVVASLGWNKPTIYLSKDLGPCINIRFGSSSSLNKSITILFPRSRISKLLADLHIIFSVLVIASRRPTIFHDVSRKVYHLGFLCIEWQLCPSPLKVIHRARRQKTKRIDGYFNKKYYIYVNTYLCVSIIT